LIYAIYVLHEFGRLLGNRIVCYLTCFPGETIMTSDNITTCHAFYIDQLIGVAAGGILLLSTSISSDLTFFYTGILFLAPGTTTGKVIVFQSISRSYAHFFIILKRNVCFHIPKLSSPRMVNDPNLLLFGALHLGDRS
jgi:hypothetical protein